MAGKADSSIPLPDQAGISKKRRPPRSTPFVSYITDAGQNGERCALPGLGSFHVRSESARRT